MGFFWLGWIGLGDLGIRGACLVIQVSGCLVPRQSLDLAACLKWSKVGYICSQGFASSGILVVFRGKL